MIPDADVKDTVYYIAICSLAVVMFAVIAALLIGLFVTSVDNKDIFAVLGPALTTIVGCFATLLGGRFMNGTKP